MPNLYNKLMAKDMPSAAAAPTSRQMVAAPMGLRSAMKRYAEGGVPQGMTPPPPDDPRRREELRPDPGYARPEETRRPPEELRPDPGYARPDPGLERMPPDIYPVPRMGGITMNDGTFIPGVDNGQGGVDIGGPAFFAKYANDPITMARLREMYGFTGAEPEYRQPQIGYNPEENVPPSPTYEPMFEPMYEPMPEPMYKPPEPMYERPEEPRDPRMEMLRKALSGQGVGSLIESQRLAELLRSMGYSK